MSYSSYLAIRLTPSFASGLAWLGDFAKVCGVLGLTRYPSIKEFCEAVRRWQALHKSLKADGVLGPRTWALMEEEVKHFRGSLPLGDQPKWVQILLIEGAFRLTGDVARNMRDALQAQSERKPHLIPACISPQTADELMWKQLAKIGVEKRTRPYHAFEISAHSANHAHRMTATSLVVTSDISPWFSFFGTLVPGQVWPGAKGGTRTILGLQPDMDPGNRGLGGQIVFVTNTGRFYTQTLMGWCSDYGARTIDQVNKNLVLIKVMLETEVAFLLGVMAATSLAAGAFVLTASIMEWWGDPRNKEIMSLLIVGFGILAAAGEALKKVAPTLHDKLYWGAIKSVLSEMPASALKDRKIMAFFIGQMIWTLGKAAMTRSFGMVLNGLFQVAAYLLQAVIVGVKSVLPVAGAAIKSVPGALKGAAVQESKDAAEGLVKMLAKANLVLSSHEATLVLRELNANPQRIKQILEQLQKALGDLVGALARVP